MERMADQLIRSKKKKMTKMLLRCINCGEFFQSEKALKIIKTRITG
jgi:ribosomal protein S26